MRVTGEPERWLVAARLSRVAKKDRDRGDEVINGIHTQDRRSTEWAQHEGHMIVHVTKDRNVSGAIAPWERPELGPWLTDPVKVVQYDGIVAYDVARVSREYFDLAWLRKWAELNHKKLYMIKERLRWPDNRDGTLWGVAAERAYEERQEIIERVGRELDALRDAGKLAGRFPFGYTSAGEKYDRYLIPTAEGRVYVPLIFQHRIDGWSLDKIAQWLDDEGVGPPSHHGKSLSEVMQWLDDKGIDPPPDRKSLSEVTQWLDDKGIKLPPDQKWWGKVVSDIIKNPTYMGLQCQRDLVPPDEIEESDGKAVRYRYGSTWTRSPRYQYGKTIHRCEELVNVAIWKRANEALAGRPRRGHVDPQNHAMLAWALFCPSCEDSPMYRIKGGGGRSRALLYYRCSGRGSHRQGCGKMVRLELVDAAVNEIMASAFNVPVMRHEIVYGNEAEIEAATERVKFELKQLASRELDWEEEDRERARLREEQTRIAGTTVEEDRVELVETDDTYLELWERRSPQDRGAWLVEQGFRVTASKERVAVEHGDVRATLDLGEPERIKPTRHLERKYWGRCECGCGTDLYGVKCRPKRYVNGTHKERARRQREAAAKVPGPQEPPELVHLGTCECGCGTDLYGASNSRKRYVDQAHKARAKRQREAAGKAQAAGSREP